MQKTSSVSVLLTSTPNMEAQCCILRSTRGDNILKSMSSNDLHHLMKLSKHFFKKLTRRHASSCLSCNDPQILTYLYNVLVQTPFDCCETYKMLSYRRETVLQGALVLAKSGRLELGYNILRTL